jgi:chromosomal replication initiator protein
MSDGLLSALGQHHRPAPISRFWFEIVDDKPPPSIADIRNAVAKHYSVPKSDMLCNRRGGAQLARQVAMYLCRRLTEHSHVAIGRAFRKADHTASLHAYRKMKNAIAANGVLAAEIATLEARFA